MNMNETKFTCTACGQHIQCDASNAGRTISCPTCNAEIRVPSSASTDKAPSGEPVPAHTTKAAAGAAESVRQSQSKGASASRAKSSGKIKPRSESQSVPAPEPGPGPGDSAPVEREEAALATPAASAPDTPDTAAEPDNPMLNKIASASSVGLEKPRLSYILNGEWPGPKPSLAGEPSMKGRRENDSREAAERAPVTGSTAKLVCPCCHAEIRLEASVSAAEPQPTSTSTP